MTIGFRAAGTATAANAAVTPLAPGVPAGLTSTDISILTVEIKGASAGVAPTITTPTDWWLIGTVTNNGTLVAGTDTGSNTIGMYYRIGTYSGPSITTSGGNSAGAAIVAYTTTLGDWDVAEAVVGSDTTVGSGISITGSAWGAAIASGDWVVGGFGGAGDNGTVTAAAIGGSSGATIGATNTRINQAVTTGLDSRLIVVDAPITAGSSTAAPTYTHTNAGSSTGHARLVRLREIATPAAIGTLTDTFTGGTIDTGKWTANGGTVAQVSNQLNIGVTAGYHNLATVDLWNLAGSAVYAEAVQLPAAQADVTTEMSFRPGSGTDGVYFVAYNGTLICRMIVGGVTVGDVTINPYVNATHRWWRFGQTGTDVLWDTSVDGTTWTNRRTSTAELDLSYGRFYLATGTWGAGTGTAIFDNVSTAPPVVRPVRPLVVSHAVRRASSW